MCRAYFLGMVKKIKLNPALILKILGAIMYLIIGIFILAVPSLVNFLDRQWQLLLGILLIIYGVVRIWRAYMDYKKLNEN